MARRLRSGGLPALQNAGVRIPPHRSPVHEDLPAQTSVHHQDASRHRLVGHSAAGAASGTGTQALNSVESEPATMIVVNCVGVGHWGPNLVRVFATHPQARVNKVCDLSEERLALVRRNIPNIGACTSDPFSTVSDPEADAVVIATPVNTHFKLAKMALEAGKHV